MKLIFAVNHPSQYHLFKNVFHRLLSKGHDAVFVVKEKDIIINLMKSDQVPYVRVAKKAYRKSKASIFAKGLFEVILQVKNLWKFVRNFKPDLMIGTDYSITHVGKILKIPTLVFNEDDFQVNKLFCLLAYPFSTAIVSPFVCNVGKYQSKKIGYNGYQKLAYLHPNVFKPDFNVVKKYIPKDCNYFIIRLVDFSAGHDIEMKHGGIGYEETNILLELLEKYGKVFITSEKPIPNYWSKYQLKIDLKDIHHILFYCDLFIADSQSMIVEAAMLGTPSIRFNSFVGKISVLEELEHQYKLTEGVHNSQPELLFKKTIDILESQDRRLVFKERRNVMLADKIDLTSFIVWLIDNYPRSTNIIKTNPEYQNNFK